MEPIRFRASFPAIQTAIKRHGSGDGMRIQLEIPECDVPKAVALLALVQERLMVTIELDKQTGSNGKPKLEKGSKRQPEW